MIAASPTNYNFFEAYISSNAIARIFHIEKLYIMLSFPGQAAPYRGDVKDHPRGWQSRQIHGSGTYIYIYKRINIYIYSLMGQSRCSRWGEPTWLRRGLGTASQKSSLRWLSSSARFERRLPPEATNKTFIFLWST